MTHRLAAIPLERMHLFLMLTLTFGTGLVDAVGYLGLDRVFTGNMTGNVVILGMALVGAKDLPIAGPILALAGFMGGAAIAGRTLRYAPGAWNRRTTALLGLVAALSLMLSVALFVLGENPDKALALVVTLLLGGAMGLQAATARVIAVKDVTTVVVTSTITGLAADSVLGSGKGGGSGRRALAVLLIVAGAMAGALLLRWHLGAGLLLSAGLVAAVTITGSWHEKAHAATAPR